MHWLVERYIYDSIYDDESLVQSLNNFGASFRQFDLLPFMDSVLPKQLNPVEFVMGSTKAVEQAIKQNAAGASYTVWYSKDFDTPNLCKLFGEDYLNHDGHEQSFNSLQFTGTAFIKPVSDLKVFSGTCVNDFDRVTWKDTVVDYARKADIPTASIDRVWVSSPKKIFREYRFFVINGRIVAQSQYKNGNVSEYSALVSEPVRDFVQNMVKKCVVDVPGYVMDIAETPNGHKVIELNTFNSAGLYYCDVDNIVAEVERYFSTTQM